VVERRYRIWVTLGLFHLMLVTAGATYFDLSKIGFFATAAEYYGEVTGSGSGYGFFAPGVTGQLRALFDIVGPKGTTKTISLFTHASHEADVRVGNIIDQFASDPDEDTPALHRALAASLAGTIFGRYPDSKKVVVRLQELWPVSMEEYREGKRAEWEPVYDAAFIHNTKRGAE
jgi:hypothetical protein